MSQDCRCTLAGESCEGHVLLKVYQMDRTPDRDPLGVLRESQLLIRERIYADFPNKRCLQIEDIVRN